MSAPERTIAERLHSGSAMNYRPIQCAREQLDARVAALQAERDALLTTTSETVATWQPAVYDSMSIGRIADLANAAKRLAELDREIAQAAAELAAIDEIRDAYTAILNPPE